MHPRILRTLIALSALVTSAGVGASGALAEPLPPSIAAGSAYVPPDPPIRSATPVKPETLVTAKQTRRVPDPPLRPGTAVVFLPSPHVEAVASSFPDGATTTTSASDFSWSSAAIGALTAALCLSMIGALAISRRKGDPTVA